MFYLILWFSIEWFLPPGWNKVIDWASHCSCCIRSRFNSCLCIVSGQYRSKCINLVTAVIVVVTMYIQLLRTCHPNSRASAFWRGRSGCPRKCSQSAIVHRPVNGVCTVYPVHTFLHTILRVKYNIILSMSITYTVTDMQTSHRLELVNDRVNWDTVLPRDSIRLHTPWYEGSSKLLSSTPITWKFLIIITNSNNVCA